MRVVLRVTTVCKEVMRYNLRTHKQYTRLLTLILILLNALLIFVGQGIKMQMESVTNSVKTNIGGDLTFEVRGEQLAENQIREYLIDFSRRYPDALEQFTFHSEPFTDFVPFANFRFTINNHMKSQEAKVYDLRAVEANLLHSVYKEYYQPKNYDGGI